MTASVGEMVDELLKAMDAKFPREDDWMIRVYTRSGVPVVEVVYYKSEREPYGFKLMPSFARPRQQAHHMVRALWRKVVNR